MDVLEWILFLNANADVLYTLVWGDKDLYELGFALAGLLQRYTQVPCRDGCLEEVQEQQQGEHADWSQLM